MNVTAHIGKKMKLNNGTVVMDIQKAFSSELDESGIVLISLQFESGLLKELNARNSTKMNISVVSVIGIRTVISGPAGNKYTFIFRADCYSGCASQSRDGSAVSQRFVYSDSGIQGPHGGALWSDG